MYHKLRELINLRLCWSLVDKLITPYVHLKDWEQNGLSLIGNGAIQICHAEQPNWSNSNPINKS